MIDMETHIYFVRSGKTGPIKIGISHNVCKRIAMMQTGNPNKLYLVTSIPIESRKQAEALEKWLHRKFKKQRIRGEWFRGNIRLPRILNAPDAWE